MPTDVILKYSDYRDEPVRVLRQAGLGYHDWITSQYKRFRGVDAPDVPDPRTETVMAFVNAGRWLWQCFGCDNAFAVEPGEPSICAACGDDWVDVILPDDRERIEAELLQQPGHRFYAPVREWRPGADRRGTAGQNRKGRPPDCGRRDEPNPGPVDWRNSGLVGQ